jgi:hypothetical protein
MNQVSAPGANDLEPAVIGRLRTLNISAMLLHAAQAVAVLVLATAFALPVTGAFLEGPPGTVPGEVDELFEIRTGWAVAAFFLMSAVAHAFVVAGSRSWYPAGLARQRNYARWIEYSFSSTVMIVVISQLTGITDVAALIGIAAANVSMILFGLLQEKYEDPGGSLLAFWLGCIAGAAPWLAIVVYAASPGQEQSPPGFVVAIIVSLFVFFNCFAVNMWLQYRQVGPWRDYLFGERTYIVLSLVAKSLLAWQVFAGTLN